jgi:homocysteine S-methyltransferase
VPNAGLPQRVSGQFVYAAGPGYFADAVPRFLDAGARIIGGCCGTTPEHIRHMRQALDITTARQRSLTEVGSGATASSAGGSETGSTPRSPIAERHSGSAAEPPPPTRLSKLLADRQFVVSVEIDPPRSVRIERTIEAGRLLQEAGVDIVNISDSAMARVRMGALAVAFGIQHDLDLECLVHFTTRDRNLMALESELLGAHALDVRNILALTGDPPRVGDYPTGTGIWDVDSVGLIGILSRLNRGEDQAGKPIGSPAGFTIACALDPTADDLATEIQRLAAKVDAGANVIMTQPIYGYEQWDRFMQAAAARWPSGLPRPVLLGILPLHTHRHAEFLHNEVPGITIPDEVRAAMAAAGERGAEVGLEMAHQLLEKMQTHVSGTYIMPSFGRYELAAELVRRIRADNRVAARPEATA